MLDVAFYDIGALSVHERSMLSAYAGPEGSVLVVYPRNPGRSIRVLTPAAFVREQLAKTSDPVNAVVAGVGSSAVGTAALARNVADYLDRPVEGVVSGFGISDALAEALGGWFVLGARNALRDTLARLLDGYELKDHVRDPESHGELKAQLASAGMAGDRFIYGNPDSTTLLYLLSNFGRQLTLLVGHSKGSYSIENALEGWLDLRRDAPSPVHVDLHVVTLGAVIWFPPEFAHLHQFIGRIDYFGMLNSRVFVQRIGVPGAWHSLNTSVPGHLSVTSALESVDVLGELLASTPGVAASVRRRH
jgi:hypothetical protein